MKILRWAAIGIGALFALLIAVSVVFLALGVTVDLGFARRPVEAAASQLLDSDVSLAGELRLTPTLWPTLEVEDVRIGKPDPGPGEHYMQVERARLQLALLALLKRTANIKEMAVEGVSVTMVMDEGAPVEAAATDTIEPAEPKTTRPTGSNMVFEEVTELRLRDIDIEIQRPARDRGSRFTLEELSGTAVPGQPLRLAARGSYQGQPYSFEIDGAAVDQLLNLRWSWPVSLKGEFAGLTVALNPADAKDKEIAYQLVVKGARLDELNQVFGVLLPPWGPYELGGLFQVSGNQYSISDFLVRIRESDLQGVLELDTSGKPELDMRFASNKLRLEDFDLGDWSPLETRAATAATEQPARDDEAPAPKALLDPELMRGLNFGLYVEMRDVRSAGRGLGGGTLELTLADGRFTLDPLAINLPEGPVRVSAVVDTTDALGWRGAHLLPDEIKAELGGATIEVTQLKDNAPADATGATEPRLLYRVSMAGERLDGLNRLAGASLPPAGPYALAAVVDVAPERYSARELELSIGESTLTGDMQLTTSGPRPRADVRLTATSVEIDDFLFEDWSPESPQGTREEASEVNTAVEKETSNGDAEAVSAVLSRETLSAQDATLALSVNKVLLSKEELGSGELEATLDNARLTLDNLQLNIPGGSLHLNASYEPLDSGVEMGIGSKVERFDYGILARHIKPDSEMQGHFSLDVDLKGRAPKGTEIMENAGGHFVVGVWPGNLEADAFDLWAVNLLVAVLPAVDQKKSMVNCAVARFQMADGVMSSEAILLDTSRMQVNGEGTVDFTTETVDIRLAPTPKKPQFFSAATPVEVRGQFEDFETALAPGALVGTAIRMMTSVVVTPIQKLTTKRIPEDGQAACAAAFSATDPEAPN